MLAFTLWVESSPAGFLSILYSSGRLKYPIAVHSEKAETIPRLTRCGSWPVQIFRQSGWRGTGPPNTRSTPGEVSLEAYMVYLLDPVDWDGTSFLLAGYHGNSAKAPLYHREQADPCAFVSKSLTIADAMQQLPDIFHTSRGTIVFSERARAVIEELAPGQVEFIPVTINAAPELAERLNLASAYYFINVLGRAQRLQWPEIPTQISKPKENGTQVAILLPDRRNWKLRERARASL